MSFDLTFTISGSLDQRPADPGAESGGGGPHQVRSTICN